MLAPRSISPGSIMPAYQWMITNKLDTTTTAAKIRTMQLLGVSYPEGYDQQANADLMKQAEEITANLKRDGIEAQSDTEIIAMIAYLQRLGTDIKASKSE